MVLTKQRIIGTALTLLDERGLDGITMTSLAQALSVQPGALYWHVKNKQDLLTEMANAMLAQEFPVLEKRPEIPWNTYLVALMMQIRKAFVSHRNGIQIAIAADPAKATTYRSLGAHIVEVLCSAGLSQSEAMVLCRTLVSFTFGFVALEQQQASAEDESYFTLGLHTIIKDASK